MLLNIYQSSLANEFDFRDIMYISPNMLPKNSNFKNLRHVLVDERTLITMSLISSCQLKTFVHFCLQIIVKSYRKTNYALQNNNKLTT